MLSSPFFFGVLLELRDIGSYLLDRLLTGCPASPVTLRILSFAYWTPSQMVAPTLHTAVLTPHITISGAINTSCTASMSSCLGTDSTVHCGAAMALPWLDGA